MGNLVGPLQSVGIRIEPKPCGAFGSMVGADAWNLNYIEIINKVSNEVFLFEVRPRSVMFFSKLNIFFSGYFDPIKTFFDNKK